MNINPAGLSRAFLDRFYYDADGWVILGAPLVLPGGALDVLRKKAVVLNAPEAGSGAAYRKREDRECSIAIHGLPVIRFIFLDLEREMKQTTDPYKKAILKLLLAFDRHGIRFSGFDILVTSDQDIGSRTFRLLLLASIAFAVDALYNRGHSSRELLARLVFEAIKGEEDLAYSHVEALGIFFGSAAINLAREGGLAEPLSVDFPLKYIYVDVGGDERNRPLRRRLYGELEAAREYLKAAATSDEEFFRAMSRPAVEPRYEVIKLRAQYCFDESKLTEAFLQAIKAKDLAGFMRILRESSDEAGALLGDNGAFNRAHSSRRAIELFPRDSKDISAVPAGCFSSTALIACRPEAEDRVLSALKAAGFRWTEVDFRTAPVRQGSYAHEEAA